MIMPATTVAAVRTISCASAASATSKRNKDCSNIVLPEKTNKEPHFSKWAKSILTRFMEVI